MLDDVGDENYLIEVECGSQRHTLSYEENKGVLLNNHGKGFDIVLSLGGKPSKCHELSDQISRIADVHRMPKYNVFAWYASGFDEVRLISWGKYASPKEASEWIQAGISRSHMVRKLHELGVTSPKSYVEWKKVSLYPNNKSADIHIIAEYIKHGVKDPFEAYLWKEAGLATPNLLPKYLKRGWSPQKLAKQNNVVLPTSVNA